MQYRTTTTILGVSRAAMGALRVGAPHLIGVAKLGTHEGTGPAPALFVRAIGFRDLALGGATLAAARRGDPAGARWTTRLGVLSDAADLAATLTALRHVPENRRWVVPAVGAAMLGSGLLAIGVGMRDLTDRPAGSQPSGDAASTGAAPEPEAEIHLSKAEQAGVVDQQDAALAAMDLAE